ncbi:c-type cytochrome [Ramlibacter sp.]|uniref:c-type cytochrome n=1 Tax=Ramlibacter sp. TaxID=1917967 RepID=UPI0026323A0C|nr:c-type cytochrome [Ramlibacter sp.]MDB5957015.1 putative cytochrome c family protein [Ramlibacter sp.]
MATPLLAAFLFLFACCGLARAAADAGTDLLAEGRALYLEGRRTDGQPLAAGRAGGLAMAGAQSACVNCHRRSGIGGSEGRNYIPPITAASLFQVMPTGKGASPEGDGRPAYTQASLAHALRDGVDPSGRALDYLMPRYRLTDHEVQALAAYLRQLPAGAAPPADASPLDFATVIAPGVAPERGRAMVDVLQACFAEHNAGPQPERGRKKLAPGMSQHEERPWRLHVWTLEGPQGTWSAQLAQHAQSQPVFAVVGGVGKGEWQPVHRFCERESLPCLFPHVDVPVADAQAFYPLYLGKGVLLEAGLIARQVHEQSPGRRVVQVLREEDEAARAGADALQAALAAHGGATQRIALHGTLAAGAFAGVAANDLLVLWLRPADLQRLEGIAPAAGQAYVSATLAESDAVPLPTSWKAHALMAYPFELPQQRALRTLPVRHWLQAHAVPAGDERIQADAYVACSALRKAMHDAQDHLGRDYLVERLEMDMERTTVTGLYPRLALGIGQRFASKAGYLVRFDAAAPGGLVPLGERVAP